MRSGVVLTIAIGLALSACAGRDPQPTVTLQPQDAYSDCTMIRAEIEANNAKTKQLADEQGFKVAQNVGAGRRRSVSLSGRFGSEWISKMRLARKWRRCKPASNFLRPWTLKDACRDIGPLPLPGNNHPPPQLTKSG